jgi:tRNA-splicing ligase RtcB
MNNLTTWLTEPLAPEVRAALERLSRAPDVRHIAVMPDVHLAHDVCIGTVLATTHLLYPGAVGGDIGCGMSALAFDAPADLLAHESAAATLLEALYQRVPANRHRAPRELPPHLTEPPLSHPALESIKRRDARVQFGTLGRGNHFLEFQADDEDRLWLMLHTGSRGIGQAIRDHHLNNHAQSSATTPHAGAEPWELRDQRVAPDASENQRPRPQTTPSPLPFIDASAPAGLAYLADMAWALDYARANRQAIVAAVCDILRERFSVTPLPGTQVDCHHNFVRRETHFGAPLWIHRKGALSAAEGEPGLIPGSMGTQSFHTQGRGLDAALSSSSHGAGRALSRDQARRAISPRDLERQLQGIWFDHRLTRHLREEAPQAYKDIQSVMRAQRPLTRITRRLHPILSYKGK